MTLVDTETAAYATGLAHVLVHDLTRDLTGDGDA